MNTWLTLAILCLAFMHGCVGQAGQSEEGSGQEGDPTSDDDDEVCMEPVNLMSLYRELREHQIDTAGTAPPEVPDTIHTQGTLTSTTANITRLSSTAPRLGPVSAPCQCVTRDELNHDRQRVPRIRVQSRCTHRRRWYSRTWWTQCEEIYHSVKVKRRSGCVDGVYQYVDSWETLPMGCSCRIYPMVFAGRG